MLDVDTIRADFPVLRNYPDHIYFDNACMSLKPRQVLEAMEEYYTQYSGCHGRSAHQFSKKTTEKYEEAREKVAGFIGAESKEVVFTRNTTEGIGLLAQQFLISPPASPAKRGGRGNSLISKQRKEDGHKSTVIISDKEHNSNLVPWLRLKKHGVIDLRVVKADAHGTLNPKGLEQALQRRGERNGQKNLVSLGYTSNLDGVTVPAREIIKLAHGHDFLVHLDAAQSAPHIPIDVKKLDVDFLTFSGHKMLGPAGTGVFYAKKELLEKMEPLVPGGGTVVGTTLESFGYLTAPEKFEGGLQDYAGMIGLGAAVDYLREIGLENIHAHEIQLNARLRDALSSIGRIGLIGPMENQGSGSITTFTVEGMEAHQVALLLDKTANIMVRSGQFCVHSWFAEKEIKAAVRVSLYLYNTEEEINRFIEATREIIQL